MKMKSIMAQIMRGGILTCALLGLVACSNSGINSQEKTVIRVGAGVTPHAEILEEIKGSLEKKGYELTIQVFEDFVLPNKALAEGELDANLYQHEPYLINFNQEQNTKLSIAGDVKFYFLPLGIYSDKMESLKELSEGASVAIPNDLTNGGRALLLLQEAGLIKLKNQSDITATVSDIVENPQKIKIIELEAAQVVRALKDVDFAVINANYILDSELSVKEDALLTESENSQAAERYASVLAIQEFSNNDKAIEALLEVLQSKETRDFINKTYKGAVIPVF